MATDEAKVERLQQLYLEGAIDGVALVAADANACATCADLADKVYMPRRLPRLPIAGCTATHGCRCRYEPSTVVPE